MLIVNNETDCTLQSHETKEAPAMLMRIRPRDAYIKRPVIIHATFLSPFFFFVWSKVDD